MIIDLNTVCMKKYKEIHRIIKYNYVINDNVRNKLLKRAKHYRIIMENCAWHDPNVYKFTIDSPSEYGNPLIDFYNYWTVGNN